MYNNYDYENFYEQTELDNLFLEYLPKAKELLLRPIKQEIEDLRSENIRMKAELSEIEKREYDFSIKEKAFERESKLFLGKLEQNFIRSNLSGLKQFLEIQTVYIPNYTYKKIEKCQLCNEKRQFCLVSPDGKIHTTPCSCNNSKQVYHCSKEELTHFSILKHKGDKNIDITFSVSISDDDYAKEVKQSHIFSCYNKEIQKVIDDIKNSGYFAFDNEKACKKYCDFENNRKD